MHKKLSFRAMGLIIVVVLVFDQLTKYWIKTSMYLGQSYSVLGDFFRITYVENPGMAFGVQIENTYVFFGLSLVAAVLVFFYLYRLRNEGWVLQSALSLIAAGAIGNLVDRFIHGRVTDFLDVEFFDIHIPAFQILGVYFPGYSMTRWPVFNVADSAVTVGMIVLIAYLLFVGDPLKHSQPSPADSSHE